jgi:hypothetical protein
VVVVGGLRAGVSAVRFELPLGAAMMGYGARQGGASACHDALHARALYLAEAGREGAEALLVECEVCLLAPAQADWIRQRVHERTGIPPERVLVGCIHTHSGPDTGLLAFLAGSPLPAHVPGLLESAVQAAERAVAGAVPARLGVGHARAAIGRNRRAESGPVDPDVLVVRVDRGGAGPLAVLYVHGCHPTALGHDNLAWSADWPWAAGRRIEAALPGATAIFALGAHADVDPRTRGLLDLAVADQSLGVGFDEVERLGEEVGTAVAEAAARIETHADAPVGALSRRVPLRVHPGLEGEEACERHLAARRAEALAALGVEDAEQGTADLFRLEQERTRHLPPAERRERIALLRAYLRDRTASRFAGGREVAVEAQVLHLGEARLLGLPAEPTVDVGLDWRRRIASPHAAVMGISNGWLRYLPHPRNFEEPDAHLKYEILMSTFVPGAAERLLDEGERLSRALAGPAKRTPDTAAAARTGLGA